MTGTRDALLARAGGAGPRSVAPVARITDAAQQTVFFANAVVSPDRTFAYDALYRLTEATGREHSAVLVHDPDGGGVQWTTTPVSNAAGDMAAYTEAFAYDHAGNLLTTSHTGTVNWTRTQAYAAASNRLATSQVGSAAAFNATHDAFGNMLAIPGLNEMQWDVFGNLQATVPYSSGTQCTFYTYDASGNRVRKVLRLALSDGVPPNVTPLG